MEGARSALASSNAKPDDEEKIVTRISQPGSGDSLCQCFLKRNRTMQTFHLYLGLNQSPPDNGKFPLVAHKNRRRTCTDYIISHSEDMLQGNVTYIGKLRSNFLGTKFTVYDCRPHVGAVLSKNRSARSVVSGQVSPRVPVRGCPVAHITYELNVLGSRGPRRMQCVFDSISATAIELGGMAPIQPEFPPSRLASFPSNPFSRSRSNCSENSSSGTLTGSKEGMLVLKNKAPRWDEQQQCWSLNFRGRATMASAKNFQLLASPESGPASVEHDKILLQFGKVGNDLFTVDYRYPISAFQAFTICLSSFNI